MGKQNVAPHNWILFENKKINKVLIHAIGMNLQISGICERSQGTWPHICMITNIYDYSCM
jgi:hypothetical protein